MTEYSIYEIPSDQKINGITVLEGIIENTCYCYIQTNNKSKNKQRRFKKKLIENDKQVFITSNQIIPCYSLDKIISISYDENGQNNIPIYILFCSTNDFESSLLSNKKFILTKMIKIDFNFIVNNGHFYNLLLDDKFVVVYITYQDEKKYKEEFVKLNINLDSIITKAFLISNFYLMKT